MRITTAQTFDTGVANLQSRQRELLEAQERMTSGKRVQRASDDPTAAARAERALAVISRSDASQRAVEASRNAMTLTESALGDASELMQQAREALVAAGNASYSDTERLGVAKQLESLRTQLLAVANRSDGAGGFVFGGQGAGQAPFLEDHGGVRFRGAPGHVQAAGDEPLPLTVNGQAGWLEARSGNGMFETVAVQRDPPWQASAWIDSGSVTDPSLASDGATFRISFAVTAGETTYSVLDGDGNPVAGQANLPFEATRAIEYQGRAVVVSGAPQDGDSFELRPSEPELNIFTVLGDAIRDLETPLRSGAAISQTTQRALRDIDQSFNALTTLRTVVGEQLNRADAVEGRVAALKLHGQGERSAAEDLDMIQAIADFQNQQTGYQAALQTYSSVQRMSLFQYLNT